MLGLFSCGKKGDDSRGTTTDIEIPDETVSSPIASHEETVVATTRASASAPAELIDGGDLSISAVAIGPFEAFDGAVLGDQAYRVVAQGAGGELTRLKSNVSIQLKLYLDEEEYPEDRWMLEICNVDGFSSTAAVVNVPGQFKWIFDKNRLMTIDYTTRCPDLWLQPIIVSDSSKVFSVYPIHIYEKKGIGLGGGHGCAISRGEVHGINCWGANSYAQAGVTASIITEPALRFAELVNDAFGPQSIAVGKNHGCTILTGGKIYCWGSDEQGQLGNGTFIIGNYPAANEIDQSPLGFNSRFVGIALGDKFSCGIRSDSKIYCWGDNEFGQIGDGTTSGRASPYQVQWPETAEGRPIKIAAGAAHACVVTDHDQLYCWGRNDHGQVQPGSSDLLVSSPRLVASDLPEGGAHRLFIALGRTITCVGSEGGDIGCFGASEFGIFAGQKSATFKVESIQSMAAGPNHICVVDKLGKTSCWGSNAEAQASASTDCSGTAPCSGKPKLLDGMPELAEIAAGGAEDDLGRKSDFSCGIKGRSLICFGNNRYSQLGAADTGDDGYSRVELD